MAGRANRSRRMAASTNLPTLFWTPRRLPVRFYRRRRPGHWASRYLCSLWIRCVHRGGPPPRGYFRLQNIDGTGLRFFGVYPLAKPSAKCESPAVTGLSVVTLCLQYTKGVNSFRGDLVCKWLIWMVEINVGCGQEDTVGVLGAPTNQEGWMVGVQASEVAPASAHP